MIYSTFSLGAHSFLSLWTSVSYSAALVNNTKRPDEMRWLIVSADAPLLPLLSPLRERTFVWPSRPERYRRLNCRRLADAVWVSFGVHTFRCRTQVPEHRTTAYDWMSRLSRQRGEKTTWKARTHTHTKDKTKRGTTAKKIAKKQDKARASERACADSRMRNAGTMLIV